MAMSTATFTLHYPDWYNERVELEMVDKGYLSGVIVELDDGSRYELYFYDPVRLAQDLERISGHSYPCIAEVNMIVIPEVTPRAIQLAVERLVEVGYFRNVKPLSSPPGAVQ